MHKHLSHGVVLPIVPTETEVAEEVKPLQIIDEEKEEENTEFPSFDESKLPSMVELDAKQKEMGVESSQKEAAEETF